MARETLGSGLRFIRGRGVSTEEALKERERLTKAKESAFVSGGGGTSTQAPPEKKEPVIKKVVEPTTRTVGVVMPVQTISLADIRRANLRTAQRNALIRLKQQGKLNLIPVSEVKRQIARARQRSEGVDILVQTLAKEQQKIRREKEKRQIEGKPSPGRDIGINTLGVVKTSLKLVKTSQDIVAGIPSFAQKGVGFVSDKPFKRIEKSLRDLTYSTIVSGLKISRRKFVTQLKTNPGEALSQAVADFYLLGGRAKLVKKAFSYEAPSITAKENLMKGIHLKVKKGERPVLFKYKRGEGVRIKDVQARISSKMKDLRKGKRLEITIPEPKRRTFTIAKDVGGGNIQDVKVTLSDGKIISEKPIGKQIPMTKRFKESGRVGKSTRQLVDEKIKKKGFVPARKGKRLEFKREEIKPVVIDLGKIKPRIPKPKPKAPKPRRRGGVEIPPKKVPPKIKKTVLKTEAGDKLIITKDLNKLRKQAQKRLSDLKRDLRKRSIKVQAGLVSEANLQAIINLRQRIKVQALRRKQADKLAKAIRGRKKKLSKLELKKFGIKVKQLSVKQQRLARKRGKKFLEAEAKVLRKKTKKELEEEARIRARILKARKGKAKLKGIKVKKLTPEQIKRAKARGVKFEKKLTQAQRKKNQAEIKKQILESRAKNFKIQKQKVSEIQNLALQRFRENNKKQLKKINTKADAVKVIEININQMKRTVQQGQKIKQQLKQVQVTKTIQKQAQQRVFIVNDKLVQAQKRLNALKKKKNVPKQKLKQEVKKIQDLKTNMFQAIAGVSVIALNSAQNQNISGRISSAQRKRQREKEGQSPRSTFVENTALSQAERQLFRKVQSLRQVQVARERVKQKRRVRPKIKVEQRKRISRKVPSKKDFLVYDVLGKSGKKFVKLSKKPLTKVDALARGSFAIDRSTARTFKIIPRGRSQKPGRILKREKGYYDKNKQKFRGFQVRKGKKKILQQTKIERKGKPLIDTRGEKRGLTLAKLIKKNKYK